MRRSAAEDTPGGAADRADGEGEQQQSAGGDNGSMRPDGGVHYGGVIAQQDDAHEGEHADSEVAADEKLGAAERLLGARTSLVSFVRPGVFMMILRFGRTLEVARMFLAVVAEGPSGCRRC